MLRLYRVLLGAKSSTSQLSHLIAHKEQKGGQASPGCGADRYLGFAEKLIFEKITLKKLLALVKIGVFK
jgi:hypothetical protein